MPSEIRKDYIQEKYVIIAPKRGRRPHDLERPACAVKLRIKKRECIFCPENIHKQKVLHTLGPEKNWLIKVIANKYSAVTLDNPRAYGKQEVVVETPSHRPEMDNLPVDHITKIFDVYAERTKVISKNKKIEYILIFKNNGGRAGASIQHAHSQIFATQFLPPHLFDKSQKVQKYKLKHGTCVYCDVIKKEQRGPRLVYKDKHVIAFAPYASIFNYEVWIMPIRHLDNIMILSADEKKSMAKILRRVLGKITKLCLPYNFYFHQVVHDEDQHLYLKVVPRGSIWAGVEIGSGVVINPVPPEDAAKYYRK